MIYIISSELPSDATSIEHMIDTLFGDTPNGLIARIMCRSGDPQGPGTLLAIETSMKQRFPQEWRVLRYSLGSLLSKIYREISEFQAGEVPNAST